MSVLEQPADPIAADRDAFLERVLQSTGGAMEMMTLFLGERLGLYRALSEGGAQTSVHLAERADCAERYVREWLEQQTVIGILEVLNPDAGPMERRYRLSPGRAEVLTEAESLNYLAPLARMMVACARVMPDVLQAFRTGGGVPYEAYGEDLHAGQAAMNRPMFLKQLGTEYLPMMQDVHQRLLSDPPARIADIGMGHGWSSIGMARAYPNVRVDGFDMDQASVEAAKAVAWEQGLSDRVRFEARDAGDPALAGRYDLVTAFECVHDMSDPVGVLRAMRRLAGENGAVLIMDERVGDTFTPQGNEVEWLMYGFSVLHCLPVGMAERPSVGTGTVMRADTLRGYAEEAGFRRVEILPIENFFFRFYRLYP